MKQTWYGPNLAKVTQRSPTFKNRNLNFCWRHFAEKRDVVEQNGSHTAGSPEFRDSNAPSPISLAHLVQKLCKDKCFWANDLDLWPSAYPSCLFFAIHLRTLYMWNENNWVTIVACRVRTRGQTYKRGKEYTWQNRRFRHVTNVPMGKRIYFVN